MQLNLFPDLPPPVNRGIGGSEIAAVFGLSPWMSPLELWRLKTDRPLAHTPNLAQQRGARLEGLVCQAFEQLAALTLDPGQRGRHPLWSQGVRMNAATDRTLPNGGIFEAKTTHLGSERHRVFATGGVPTIYALQLQHYAATLRVEHGVIACLAGPAEAMDWEIAQCILYAVAFRRSIAIGELLEEAVRSFYQHHVFPDVPPPDGPHPLTALLLSRLASETWLGPYAGS